MAVFTEARACRAGEDGTGRGAAYRVETSVRGDGVLDRDRWYNTDHGVVNEVKALILVELEEVFGAEIHNGRVGGRRVDRVAAFKAEVLGVPNSNNKM